MRLECGGGFESIEFHVHQALALPIHLELMKYNIQYSVALSNITRYIIQFLIRSPLYIVQ